jgi:hypothetical protein
MTAQAAANNREIPAPATAVMGALYARRYIEEATWLAPF